MSPSKKPPLPPEDMSNALFQFLDLKQSCQGEEAEWVHEGFHSLNVVIFSGPTPLSFSLFTCSIFQEDFNKWPLLKRTKLNRKTSVSHLRLGVLGQNLECTRGTIILTGTE